MKKISIFLFSLLFLFSFYHSNKSQALEVNETWVLINEESNLLIENTTPKPSDLEWCEKIVSKSFERDEKIKFSSDNSILRDRLGITEDDLKIQWEFSDGESFESENFLKSFINFGNYFVTARVFDSKGDQVEEINFMVVIGASPLPTAIKVNGEIKENSIYEINSFENTEFSIVNANENYLYTWDMGDGDLQYGESIFKSFGESELPVYVTLRTTDQTTNTFRDSFVRIEGHVDQGFNIITPTEEVKSVEVRSINSALAFSSIFFIIVMSFYGIKRIVKTR